MWSPQKGHHRSSLSLCPGNSWHHVCHCTAVYGSLPRPNSGLLRAVPVLRLIPQVWGWVRPSGGPKGQWEMISKATPHPGHRRPVSRSLCLWAGAAVGDPRAGCPRTLQPLWLGQGGGASCSPGVPLGPAGPMHVQGCVPHSRGPLAGPLSCSTDPSPCVDKAVLRHQSCENSF